MTDKEMIERIIEHLEDIKELHEVSSGYRSYHFIPAYLAGFMHGVLLSTPFEDTASIWRQILILTDEVDEEHGWNDYSGDPVHYMEALKYDGDKIIQIRISREIEIMQKLLKLIDNKNEAS